VKAYLIFRLYGPMCAWGDIAVGEQRPSAGHPAKSAVLGLLAAALGVRRDEEGRQKLLADAYAMAVRVDVSGELLRDYHAITVQTPHTALLFGPKATALHGYCQTYSPRYNALIFRCTWAENLAHFRCRCKLVLSKRIPSRQRLMIFPAKMNFSMVCRVMLSAAITGRR